VKFRKSVKALSPVVASIILIAVTVAVSIAVAAWMGALTFSFTATEQLTFSDYSWGTDNTNFIIEVKNTGTADLSVAEIRIDGQSAATVSPSLATPLTIVKGNSTAFTVTHTPGFSSGITYEFTVFTAKGNQFGPYIKTAP
jgi:flagellin-like protein